MDIKINRYDFYKSISKVQNIIEKRSNMPILSTILLTATDSFINISATDLEISLQQTVPAEVINQGSITISGKKLFDILKESKSETIYIQEKENNWVFISDNKTTYNLACLPADEYPVFVEPEGVVMINIDGDTLSEMIHKTIYSVTLDEAGFKLSGIYIEKKVIKEKTFLRMVTTDGHRLSMIDKEIANIEDLSINEGVMVPKKGMMELSRLVAEGGNISIGFKQNNCVAKKDNSLIVIRLLETKFPDYNIVIPNETKYVIQVQRDLLMDGMKKMLIMSSESYRGVKIALDNNKMELISINPDLGDAKDSIEIEFNGEPLEIGFNSRFFMEVLQAMDSEIVKLGFSDGSSPCMIKGDDDGGFLGLVMPMRI